MAAGPPSERRRLMAVLAGICAGLVAAGLWLLVWLLFG